MFLYITHNKDKGVWKRITISDDMVGVKSVLPKRDGGDEDCQKRMGNGPRAGKGEREKSRQVRWK